MQGSRFHRRILVLGAVVAGLSFYACAEQDPVSPEVEVNFAKGGGGPSVDAAQPSNAPQNITLDVQVIGSRFDNGSVAKWLLAGQSTPKVVVNSSTFIDRNTLVANITIEADADIALYDIEVTTSRGKKGIGSEIFSVRKRR